MELLIDITPLAINRTAMFFIVRDTIKHIYENSSINIKFHALGLEIDKDKLIESDFIICEDKCNQILERLIHLVTNCKTSSFVRKFYNEDAKSEHISFVFDPLYLLFAEKGIKNISFVLDSTPITRPEWHSSNVSKCYKEAFNILQHESVSIISISDSTTRDLWANLGLPKSRVTTVKLYNRFNKHVKRAINPLTTFLFVGSLETRKNIALLCVAFKKSDLFSSGWTLRVVGQDAHGSDEIKKIADNVPGVVLLGRIDDNQLIEEYETCSCLVYPSLWEGFGLPALEALSNNIPLILSDSGALPEIGGLHAIYINPESVDSIVKAFKLVADNDFEAQITNNKTEEIRNWVKQFSRDVYFRTIENVIGIKK
jgi:glycosyltransferase involved in cell wall biosynthesis